MKRLASILLLAVLAALVAAGGALAKGPSEGSVAGPGLSGPIDLSGDEGSGPLGEVTQASGFFPSVFRQVPDPMLEERPAGTLGPRYVVTYAVPGPNNERDVLRQELYPYATPSAVSHMAPGQAVFGTERTRGGWFVAGAALTEALVRAGLPESPPAAGAEPGSFPWGVVLASALLAVLLATAGVRLRRRQQPAAT